MTKQNNILHFAVGEFSNWCGFAFASSTSAYHTTGDRILYSMLQILTSITGNNIGCEQRANKV